MITDEYAAGAIDARAVIRASYPGSKNFVPLMQLTSTDPILVEELYEQFGGETKSFRPHEKPETVVHVWQTKRDTTLAVLERVLPYLVGRARDHAEDVLIRAGEEAMADAAPQR